MDARAYGVEPHGLPGTGPERAAIERSRPTRYGDIGGPTIVAPRAANRSIRPAYPQTTTA